MDLYKKEFEKGKPELFIRRKLHNLKILELLNPQKKDRILDIGCGDGALVKFLRSFSDFVIGIDINKDLIENSNIQGLKAMPAEKLEFENNFFDKIVSAHTIEHILDLKKTFSEIKRVLKKNGICVLIYPLEIFKGSNIILHAWLVYGNPFLASKLHTHKLNNQKVKNFTDLKILKKGIFFGPFPTYYTVLKK